MYIYGACSFDLNQLNEEVMRHYPSHNDLVFSIVFVDKYVTGQSFIELNSDENFTAMLRMYEQEKEVTIYVSTDKNFGTHNTQESAQHEIIKEPNGESGQCEVIEEPTGDGDSDHCPSDENYFSHLSSDDDDVNEISNYDYSNTKKSPTMEVSSKLPSVVAFRRALNHHAVINEYDYFIEKSDLERFTARCYKRRIVRKWNGTLVPMAKSYLRSISKASKLICRSNDNHAEVKRKGKRWQVILDERNCSCRVWHVKGLPCVHASAFISFTRDNWEKYCDPYFTIEKFKDAYAFGVATMPGKDQWVRLETGEKIYPPIIKRPAGRPRKNRFVPTDETKKGTDVSNVVNSDTVKSHAKIHQLKVLNLVKHLPLKVYFCYRRRGKKTRGDESSAAELGSKQKGT
ncbi:transposase, MuDR [Tanacetum coccineum]